MSGEGQKSLGISLHELGARKANLKKVESREEKEEKLESTAEPIVGDSVKDKINKFKQVEKGIIVLFGFIKEHNNDDKLEIFVILLPFDIFHLLQKCSYFLLLIVSLLYFLLLQQMSSNVQLIVKN